MGLTFFFEPLTGTSRSCKLPDVKDKPLHPFTKFAQTVARQAGHPTTFGVALGFLAGWIIFGPLLDYHPVWMDFFAVTTGIFTFLMVFLIQNTQNRDTEALHLKLDELLRATKGARWELINSEDMEEAELDAIKENFSRLVQSRKSQPSEPKNPLPGDV